jgi:hypothetical protein
MYRGSHGISLFSTQFLSYRDRISPNRSACRAPGAEAGDRRRRLRFCDRAQRRRAQVVLSLANETSRKRPTLMVRPTGANAGRSGDCAHAEARGRCEANRCGTVAGPREASAGASTNASPNAGGQRAGMLGEAHPVERRPPPSLRGCGIESVRRQGFSQGDEI